MLWLSYLSARLNTAEAYFLTFLYRQEIGHQGTSKPHCYCRGQDAQGRRFMHFLCIELLGKQKCSWTQAVSDQMWPVWSLALSLFLCLEPRTQEEDAMVPLQPLSTCVHWLNSLKAWGHPLVSVGQRLSLPLRRCSITCESILQWAAQDGWQMFTGSKDAGQTCTVRA